MVAHCCAPINLFFLGSFDKEKLIHIANSIFNSLANENDYSNILIRKPDNENEFSVSITAIFPQFKMPLILQQNVIAMAKIPTITDSSVFRC